MKYTSDIDKANGICRAHVTGEFHRPHDSDELKRFAIDTFTRHACSRFLIDLTEAQIDAGTMSTFTAANPQGDIANSLRKIRTAFVRHELNEDDRFFETVAVNRGFQLRAFETCEKAVEWLTHG